MKKLTIVFLLLVVLATLVVFRLADRRGYKNEPAALLATLKQGTFFIAPEKVDQSFLVLNLGKSDLPEGLVPANRLDLPIRDLQKKENLELLRKPGQKVAIVSADVATSVKVFTYLHQIGVGNLFIVELSGLSGEVLKYKFVPEPMAVFSENPDVLGDALND